MAASDIRIRRGCWYIHLLLSGRIPLSAFSQFVTTVFLSDGKEIWRIRGLLLLCYGIQSTQSVQKGADGVLLEAERESS